jgi:hypothetical protein
LRETGLLLEGEKQEDRRKYRRQKPFRGYIHSCD